MKLNSRNVFLDLDLSLPNLRAFGLLCHLDSGSGISQAKKQLLDITPHCCMLKRLFIKGYIDIESENFGSKILVNTTARFISGFAQEMVLNEKLNIFLDGELNRSDLRSFGILSKLDTGEGVKDFRKIFFGIFGSFLPTKNLCEKNYVSRSKGRLYVNPDARRGSGFAQGKGECGFEIPKTEEMVYKIVDIGASK